LFKKVLIREVKMEENETEETTEETEEPAAEETE